MAYHYHIEDGQLSYDVTLKELLGKEGDIVEIFHPHTEEWAKIYILYVDKDYVECIGNIERSFPTDEIDHELLKKSTRGY